MHEIIRTARERAVAEEWALVLTTEGIESSLAASPEGWHLYVQSRDGPRAKVILDAYGREQEDKNDAAARLAADYGTTYVGIVVALFLLGFHAITIGFPEVDWFARGAASASAIEQGELWRTVTALTLHAGPAHVVNNAVAGGIFLTATFRVWGPGIGLWLVLLAGAIGNLANGLLRSGRHSAIGASTAVFGAIGLLAGYQFLRSRPSRTIRGSRWLPIAAGLALLAWLGTSPHSDVVAHLLGFLAGLALGALATRIVPRVPPLSVQSALLAAAALGVATCWLLALK